MPLTRELRTRVDFLGESSVQCTGAGTMRAGLLICCWLAGMCIPMQLFGQNDRFGSPDDAAPKILEKSPFWVGEPLKFQKLKKVDVRLLEKPNEEIDFAVIQVGASDPVNYLDDARPSNVSAFVEKAEITYAIGDEPLEIGSKVYRDRKYVIQELPELLK